MPKFNIFDRTPLNSNYMGPRRMIIKNFFASQSEEDLNNNKDTYENILMEQHKIYIPQLDFENIKKEMEEVGDIDVYIFKIPFTPINNEYFQLKPSVGLNWTHQVFIEGQDLCFEIQDTNKTVQEIKNEKKSIINNIKDLNGTVEGIVNSYNDELKLFINEEYNKRKDRLSTRKQKMVALGI